MKLKKIQILVTAALFAAIICVATFVVKIPSPATNGYFNLGDCFVILSGMLLGPVYGALAAGLGSALADILSGYAQYAPATFIIKALMALSVYFVIKAFKGKAPIASKLCSGFMAETIMVLGYFGYEAIILDYGIAAAGSIFSNVMQGTVGIIAALAVSSAISKSKTLTEFFRKG
ncbi:MAG: ECF transporter S component [Clostridia bacterium]|nr:ECF transporter S component [Clostridia bacterium]